MAQFHFVEDYEKYVAKLIRDYPLDEAMSHLNMFIERNAIGVWAERLGFTVDQFISAGCPVWDGHALGQAVAVLRKPA